MPRESKVKRGLLRDPVASAGAGARRRHGSRCVRDGRTSGLGRPEHSRNRWCARALTRCPPCHDRMVGLGKGATDGCHTPGQPPRHTRQTGTNRRPPPPRQEPCHRVGCSPPDGPDRLTRSTAPPQSPPKVSEPAQPVPRPRESPCRWRPTPTVIVPPHGVPAERRQESCRSPTPAPRGRPATDRPASLRSRSSHSSSHSAGYPPARLPHPPPASRS